jgi:hypothetical protein
MDALTFLKSLPAVLGIVGFFAYLWAGQYRLGGELMKTVVEKLRVAPNVDIKDYASLTPARIEQLIKHDSAARNAVNDQDIRLIRLIVILQYVVTVFILIVCSGLVALGVWLISRPEPLSIVPHPPTSARSTPDAVLVDLDPLKVVWDANGMIEHVSVFLENVAGERRSVRKSVLADVHEATFTPDEVHDALLSREYHGINRIRTVVEWSGHTVRSNPIDLPVGIKVRLMIGGTLVTPKATRPIHTLVATIDDSTEHMPNGYCFHVDFAGWNHSGPLVAPLKSCNADSEVTIPFLADIDWSHQAGLVFDQPNADRLLARTCIASPEIHNDNC